MKDVKQLDEVAMARIAKRVREMMIASEGDGIMIWMKKYSKRVNALARFTWLATREELDR